MNKLRSAKEIQKDWDTNPRWKNVKRDYTAEEVVSLRSSGIIDYTLAKKGAEKFISLYESASDINKERLLHIASKSKRGFLNQQ